MRLDKLKTAAYAYTTDSETNPKNKAARTAEKIKRKSLQEMYVLSDFSSNNDDWKFNASPRMYIH